MLQSNLTATLIALEAYLTAYYHHEQAIEPDSDKFHNN